MGVRNDAFFIAEKREVIMRKLCAVILSAVVWLVAAGTPASAAEHQSTLSAGYLQTHTDMPGSDDLKGINVKYRYEFTDTLGLVTSFSYANAKDEQKTHYSDTRWHEDSVRNRWFSMMAGPSVRVNEWFRYSVTVADAVAEEAAALAEPAAALSLWAAAS